MMERALRNTVKVQTQHEEKLVNQEGRARRENIRIYNVPEDEEGSSMVVFVEKLLREKLDIPPTTELHIERAHRALVPKPPATGKLSTKPSIPRAPKLSAAIVCSVPYSAVPSCGTKIPSTSKDLRSSVRASKTLS